MCPRSYTTYKQNVSFENINHLNVSIKPERCNTEFLNSSMSVISYNYVDLFVRIFSSATTNTTNKRRTLNGPDYVVRCNPHEINEV